ncbi:MAG: hypothetical protein ABFC24_01345 [Methanoregulaceae archaeon]
MMRYFQALAGQSPVRVTAKAAVSLIFVGLAAFVSHGGPALAILIIFMGVTGPTLRLVTMKMDGIYDRIIVSPVPKFRFFLGFTGLWSIAVLLPLLPTIVLVAVLSGPVTIVPVVMGTILAASLGTLAGSVSRGLSEAHLAALALSALLIVLSIVKTPVAIFLPYTALSAGSADPIALAASAILTVIAVVLPAGVVSRT